MTAEADHLDHFASLAAGGEGNDGIFRRDETEIAMRGFSGMQVCSGRAGGAEGGSELTRDVSGFADARGEDFTLGVAQGKDGALEIRGDADR